MIYYLQMQDLDHSFHSPKYELTISHGDPIHGPGSFLKSSSFAQLPLSGESIFRNPTF